MSNRVDKLKALGNGVVPAQAWPIFAAIVEEDAGEDGPLFSDREVAAAYTAKSILEQAGK